MAIDYAMGHQNRPIAREIVMTTQSANPEIISDMKRGNVSIKSVSTGDTKPKTIKLFKSPQEKNFYEGVIKAFPFYAPYPNVALHRILDLDAFRTKLTEAQLSYFF